MAPHAKEIYTDGACSGNPGPGGWAWADTEGGRNAGGARDTTNQRMELQAVLEAVRSNSGQLTIYSDSTYVVNCFNDQWYEGWLKRDWKNSQKKPVANRDLWEPLVELYLKRSDELTFIWVKGHSGNKMNDLVDAMAVSARDEQMGHLEDDKAEEKRSIEANEAAAAPDAPWNTDGAIAITGATELTADQIDELEITVGGLDTDQDVLVSGLRRGPELLAAEYAIKNSIPLAVVLPFSDPARRWPASDKARFDSCIQGSQWLITLEGDDAKPATAVAARDRWLWNNVVGAIVVGDSSRTAELEESGLGVIEIL